MGIAGRGVFGAVPRRIARVSIEIPPEHAYLGVCEVSRVLESRGARMDRVTTASRPVFHDFGAENLGTKDSRNHGLKSKKQLTAVFVDVGTLVGTVCQSGASPSLV